MHARRPSAAAVRSLAAVPAGGGRQLLAAAYSDASLRIWSVPRQACALHEPLRRGSATAAQALSPTRLAFADAPADEPGRPGKLVVQLDPPAEAAGGAAVSAGIGQPCLLCSPLALLLAAFGATSHLGHLGRGRSEHASEGLDSLNRR